MMNKRKFIMIICLVLCFFISISAVCSAEDGNNQTVGVNEDHSDAIKQNDVNEDSLKESQTGTFKELNDLINNNSVVDGDTVELNKDYVFIPGVDDSFTNGIYFTKNIKIDGKGHIINASNQARIFGVGSTSSGHTPVSNVVLMNIHFANAKNIAVNDTNEGNGIAKNKAYGAVEFYGNGKIENCNFTNNYAWCAAAIAIGQGMNIEVTNCRFINNTGFGQGGGAIRLRTQVNGLTIRDSWFENNHGDSYGGAVHSDRGSGNGNILVENCDFINNTANVGAGGLFFETAGGILKDSRFENNSAPLGGAVYWNGVSGKVVNCNFTHNIADNRGGAIYTSNRSTTNITTSNFNKNIAAQGGAIFFDNTTNSSIYVCSFSQNAADFGGAIYCSGQFFIVVNSNFTKDRAVQNGAGLYLDVGAYVNKCQFNGEDAAKDGGGIYLYAKHVAEIPAGVELGVFSTNFTACHAGHDGGAGYVYSHYGVVKDAILKDCTAGNEGGAGYIYGNYGKLINSQLIGNNATFSAGALYWLGSNGTIINTTFRKNKAFGNGGAIYWTGNNGTIFSCNFTDNHAIGATGDGNGGSLVWMGSNGKIDKCEFNISSAKKNGGVADIVGHDVVISQSNFTKYNAPQGNGGALCLEGDNVNITKSNFGYGEARFGGVVYITGDNTYMELCNLTRTHANEDGGLIYIAGDGAVITDSYLSYTYSENSGGSIFINGKNNLITKSHFACTNATNGYGGSIFIKGGYNNITYSTFNQSSSTKGGVIYINGTDTRVEYSNFTRTGIHPDVVVTPDADGGTIYIEGDHAYIAHGIFNLSSANEGGFIYVAGDDAKIEYSQFSRSSAYKEGGAIDIHGRNVLIFESSFTLLNASANGGAINIEGDNVNITNSNFTLTSVNGTAVRGGAIFVGGNDVNILDCRFNMTRAFGGDGGAIYVDGNRTNVRDIRFNLAASIQGNGGAMYIAGSDAKVSYSDFVLTSSVGNGGAIYIAGNKATVTMNSFLMHNATNGGALFVSGDDANITYCNFTKSLTVDGHGGAIYIRGDHVDVSTLKFNQTSSTNGNGGTIYVEGDYTTLYNTNFTLSYADNGGVIYIEGNNNLITGNNFSYNNASIGCGGAIFIEGANNNITQSIFDACSSTKGGAIFINGTDTRVTYSNFTRNGIHPEWGMVSGANGGAINIAGDNAVISNDDFLMSRAYEGGFIYISGNDAEIRNSTFSQSSAHLGGGAIDVHGNRTLITESSFSLHNTTTKGGTVNVEGDGITISNSNFTITSVNGTGTKGGAIYVGGKDVDVVNCTFNITRAYNGDGGSIYVEGDSADIKDCNFTVAMAIQGNGGTLYIAGDDVNLDNCHYGISQAIGSHRDPVDFGGCGGVIYIEGNRAKINDTDFTNYFATFKGGALFVHGDDVNITYSKFHEGKSRDGAAMYIEGSNTNVLYSNFTHMGAEDNHTLNYTTSGGAIYAAGNDTLISYNNFNQTNAGRGGAIYVAGERTEISDNEFSFHNAGYGGVIYVSGNDTNISATSFSHIISVYEGGAIWIGGENTHISASEFSYLNSTRGGAIYIEGSRTVIESNFSYCFAKSNSPLIPTAGGAIFVAGEDNEIRNSNFNMTIALNGNGGAIYAGGRNNTISNISTTSVRAIRQGPLEIGNGGAIYIEGDDAKVKGSEFTQFFASENGGAVFVEGDNVNITYSCFHNGAAKDGVAIYIKGSNTQVWYSNFTEMGSQANQTLNYTTSGGAIYVAGNDTLISCSEFSKTNAGQGGAIYVAGERTGISNSTFTRHNAGRGGAIYIGGNYTRIAELSFESIESTFEGGAIYISGENAVLFNSTFLQTRVNNGDGGAIYIAGNNSNVSHSSFALSMAYKNPNGGNGGVIYIAGDDAIVEYSNFTLSFSDNEGGAIYIAGANALVDSSIFEKVNATEGGAIYVSGDGANITNSNFTLNIARVGNGGAIYIAGDDVDVVNSTFNHTRADNGNGGAIYINGTGANVSASNFTHNFALYGGVIYVMGEESIVENSHFINSYALGDGGAIYIKGENAVIDASTFEKHNATNGGTIYILGEGANITNSNFTLSLSQDGNGGAIYIEGNEVNIFKSRFNETKNVNGNGGVIYIAGNYTNISGSAFDRSVAEYGGTIYILGQNSTIEFTNISRSNATYDGGSIFISGDNTHIENCNFTLGNGRYGGAIYIKGTNVHVHDSNFTKYFAKQDGGTFYIKGDYAHIGDSKINSSYSYKSGGAVYITGNYAWISKSNLTQNNATDNGGAIYVYGHHTNISTTAFEKCTSKEGGAIYIGGANTLVNASNFTKCNVKLNGGAIYINGVNATVVDSIFSWNNATMNATSKGGGIYVKGANANIIGSYFEKSNSRFGAAIYIEGVYAAIKKSSFNHSNVTADGGAIYILGNYALVENSKFNSSTAYGSGGLMYIQGNYVNVTNSNFSFSVSHAKGGAIYIQGLNATIFNSTFFRHNATEGGAVYISGKNAVINSSQFLFGHASENAGAVYLGPHTYVYNSTFDNNSATTGGAMYNAGQGAIVEQSNFTNNVAAIKGAKHANGGAIFWVGGSNYDSILNCYFVENKALNLDNGQHYSCGGAIYWSSGSGSTQNASIVNSTFYKNVASRHGGAIDWFSANNGVIRNCNFTDNTAHSDGGALYAGDDGSTGKNLTVKDCNFTNNRAEVRGGAISLQFGYSHIMNCIFLSNVASEGGSLFSKNSKASNCEYVNCKIINSKTNDTERSSGNGGGAFIATKDTSFVNCEFINCSALAGKNGGGIYLNLGADYAKLEGCNFTNCHAYPSNDGGDGGAIYIYGESVTQNNVVTYYTTTGITINNSIFTDVSAKNGGAIFMLTANLLINKSTFTNSSASQSGGAIYINTINKTFYINNTIANSVIKDGSANENGGAVYIKAYNTTIADSAIFGNLAVRGAGIYLNDTADVAVSNTNITNNNATRGSGIYAEHSNYTLSSVKLLENQAHATAFINESIKIDENGKFYVTAVFTGEDNLLNAIWNDESSNAVSFTNVTYWDAKGVAVTNTVPELSTAEAGQNVTVSKLEMKSANTVVTDENGVLKYYFDNTGAKGYKFNLNHPEDKYYTAINQNVSILATNLTIYVADIDFGQNATVNVTLVDANGTGLTANVTIKINGTHNFTIVVINGNGSCSNVSGLAPGIYNATAVFAGNDSYIGSKNSTLFKVRTAANITMIKKADLTNVTVGTPVNFTIEIHNAGESTAHNVIVTDKLPDGLAYIISGSGIADQGSVALVGGSEVVTWYIGNLTGNATVKVWISVNTTRNDTFANVAVVNSTEGGVETTEPADIKVDPAVELIITKTVNKNNVSVEDIVEFTITVINKGPSDANGVNVTDILDSKLKYLNSTATQGRYNSTTHKWHIGNITSTRNVTLTIVAQVISNGTIPNIAVVSCKENATDKNASCDNITAYPKVNLTITKTTTVTNASVGDFVNFTIVVTNYGPSNATSVNVTDILPDGLAYIDSGSNVTGIKGTNVTLTNGSRAVIWNIPLLTNGTSISLWVQTNLTTNGTIRNVAFAKSNENETDTTDSVDIEVKPVVNLVITKTVNITNVYVEDIVEFTITVINRGPSNATCVNVSDVLDSKLKYINSTATQGRYNSTTHRWDIGNITSGRNVTLTIVAQVISNGTIPNIAFVTCKENDTDKNASSKNITANPKVNLTVIKKASLTNASVGDLINFTITVTNHGPSNATDVKVSDILNSAFGFVNASGGVTPLNRKLVWTIDKIENGTNATVWVQVRLLTNGSFVNVAIVNCSENKTNVPSNGTNVTANPDVNLTIIKTVNVANATVGDLINFTITVINHGLSNATNVKVTDVLDSAFKLVNATGSPDVSGQKLVWTIDKIQNGTNASVWVQVRLLTNGTFTNVASVNCTENKTNVPSNGTNVTVNPDVNLTIIKVADISNATVGDLINFTITVTNNGLSNATNVKVTDVLDSAFKLVNATGSPDVSGQKLVWTIDKIQNGTNASVWVQVRLLTNGTFVNVATANCTENKTNVPSNGTNVTANPDVNLTIIKTASVTNATVGDLINFTITVTNKGLSNATNVKVTDVLDSAFKLVNTTGNPAVTGHKLVWTIDKIQNGTNASVWVQVRLLTNGTFTNVASVNCTENKTNVPSNDTNVTVSPDVNLTIIKTVNVANATVGDLINFTITVTNNGLSNATGVKVTDVLDSAFKLVNATGSPDVSGQKLVWTIDKIQNGTNASVWVQVRLLTNGTFTNVASVNCSENKTNVPSNGTNVTANPDVNLTIIKVADISTATVGDLINFTITVINNGLSNATNVKITDVLDSAFKLVNTTGNPAVTGHKLVWTIDKIQNGTDASVWVQVKLLTNGTFTNVASVNCSENKTNVPSNGTNVTVSPDVNLTIIKTVSVTNATVGDLINFTITVTNNGLSNATNVKITDELNSAFKLVNTTGSPDVTGQKLVWTIDKIQNGTNASVWVQVRLLTNGTFTNVATVNCTENKTDVISNDTNVTVIPDVDLTIIKVADISNASVGDLINFTITVINNGLSNATNVKVSDVLNSAFKLVNSTGSPDVTGQKLVWTIDKIQNGTNTSVWVQVKLLTNGTFTNVATVNCTENKTDVTSNVTNITVNPKVNLTIIKYLDGDASRNISVGELIKFIIVVKNNGPSNATDVIISDVLSDAFDFKSSNVTHSQSGQKITWNIGRLNVNDTRTIELTVETMLNGFYSNVAIVNSTESENVTSNRVVVTILPAVNLTVVKKSNVIGNVSVGDMVNFTITVTNNGPSTANDVNITDVLVSAFEFKLANGTYQVVGNNTVFWNIGQILKGESVSVWLQVKVLTNGTFSNVASANCTENKTGTPSNESNVTVSPVVNLTIIKTVDVANATVGDLVNFTITVINHGPSNATAVKVSDVLDNAFKLVNASGNPDVTGQKLVWTIDKIQNGTNASVWVQVRLLTNGTFTNVASVNCFENTTDVPSNGTNVTADPNVNLTVVKTADVSKAIVGDLINFTITVTNNGLSNATNVKVTDVLDSAFKLVNASGNPDVSGQKLVWTINKIENGTSASVWVQVKLLTNGTFTNVATVNSTENATDVPSNGTNVTANPDVKLVIVKTANVTKADVGDLINFTITVTNNGLSNATNVKISDVLDSAFKLVNASGNPAVAGQKLIWTISKLENGTNASVWVQVKLITNGTFTNVATVNSTENTTDVPSNTTNVTSVPVVDLSIVKTVSKTEISIGDTIVYIITVTNNGPSNATGVVITENLAGSVEFISVVPSMGQFDQNTRIWTINQLDANDTQTLTLTVKALKVEIIENSVSVKSNENDTNMTNNNDTCDNVTVNSLATPISLETEDIMYGDDEFITVTLPEKATGTVNITVGNMTCPDEPISKGIVKLRVSGLDCGKYNVTVVYGGDGTYGANSTRGSFTVSPVTPVITIEVVDIYHGEIEVLNVTVNAPGYVNITVGNGVGTITASLDHSVQSTDVLQASPSSYDGEATWRLINLKVGTYPVSAIYLGDQNHKSVSTTSEFRVLPLPSEVNVTANDIYVGEDAIIQVSVTPGASGNVTLTIEGKNYVVYLNNGKGQIAVSGLKAGLKKVTAKYNGDDVYLPSENTTTFKVKKIKPPIDVESEDIHVGDDETITVTLPEDATGTVTITVDGKKYTADVVDGEAVFKIEGLKAGKYGVKAEYSGDDKYLPTAGSDSFKVSKLKPDVSVFSPDITVGENGKVTVKVPHDATGTVTIEINGKRYTQPVRDGRAVFTIPGLEVGLYDIDVWYSGDDKYLPGETAGEMNVLPIDDDGDEGHDVRVVDDKATGNPILMLVVVLLSMIGVSVRKFRK